MVKITAAPNLEIMSLIAAGTSYTNHDLETIISIFYILFYVSGFQRVGDLNKIS